MNEHPSARALVFAISTAFIVLVLAAPLAAAGGERGWVQQLGGGNRDFASAIAFTEDGPGDTSGGGGPAIAGRFRGQVEIGGSAGGRLAAAGLTDAFVAQLDGGGALRWAVRLGGSGADEAKAVAAAPGGGLYVAGFFSGAVRFAPALHLKSAGSSDAFVARLEADGSVRWARAFGGPRGDVALAVASAEDGRSVAVAGYFQGSADLDPGRGSTAHASAGRRDAFIAVLDAEGGLRWARRLGGGGNDEAAAVTALDGGWALAGRFEQTLTWGEDEGSGLRTAGGRDAFVAGFDGDGGVRWLRRIGGAGRDDAAALAVLPNRAGSKGGGETLLVAGGFEQSLAIDGPGEVTALESAGGRDVYLLALEPARGATRFAARFGDASDDYATGLAAGGGAGDGDGEALFDLAGFSLGLAGEGGDEPGRTRSFVHRLRPPAEALWTRTLDAEWGIQILGLARGGDGTPYLAGSFKGAARLELGGDGDVTLDGSAKIDAFVAALVP